MKLCPQCQFIYEDDQSICDMDGRELVYDPGPLAFEGTVRFTSPNLHEPAPLPVNPLAGRPASQPIRGQSRRSAVAALAAIILVALLFVVYYARTLQPRSGNANQASNQTSLQSASQSTQLETTAEKPAPDLDSPSASLTASPEQSQAASPEVTTSSPSSLLISPAASFSRARVSSSSVSAGGSAAQNRGPVTIWLTNGASIKADEAWERREGIWYRQAGMVTFLRRSRVRSIQRLAAPNPRPKSTATIAEVKDPKPESVTAQNQPRAVMPEPASAKKDSKVSSFLKKTGRILKRPFKF